MSHDEIVTYPSELRSVAQQLLALADRASGMKAEASGAAGTPARGQFSELAIGQRMAQVWGDGQQTFADGLGMVRQALARLSDNFASAADGYEAADAASADHLESLRD